MKLVPQPRPVRRAPKGRRGAVRAAPRRRGRGAQRPGVPLRRRFAGRLPPLRRVLAGLAAMAAVAGLVALLNGPWLRVTTLSWDGARYTPARAIEEVLVGQRGRSILEVDTRALDDRLERLPAVSEAVVTASLTGSVEARVVEREAAFVWETASARFVGDADGTVFIAIRGGDELPDELAPLPRIRDERFVARLVSVGDRIAEPVLETALRILAVDPSTLGSAATDLSVRIDDDLGFSIGSADLGWEIALGAYGTDPRETSAEAAARLERQVTAVRTLFAREPESDIGWVDARNPGKVYFRAKG